MNVLIEFLVFIFALPAIFLYLVFSTLRTIADFFGWTFIPGVLCMHLGVTLYALGQPDPPVCLGKPLFKDLLRSISPAYRCLLLSYAQDRYFW